MHYSILTTLEFCGIIQVWWRRWLCMLAAPHNTVQKGGSTVAISKAQQRATANYVKKAYDRIEAKVAKGKKNVIQAHAEAQGESLNAFINRAINETMERDNSATE